MMPGQPIAQIVVGVTEALTITMRRFLIGLVLILLLLVSIGIGVAVARWPELTQGWHERGRPT